MGQQWQNSFQARLHGVDMDTMTARDASELVALLAEHFNMALTVWDENDIRDRLEEAYTTDANEAASLAHEIAEGEEWAEASEAIVQQWYDQQWGWERMADVTDAAAVKAGLKYGQGVEGEL